MEIAWTQRTTDGEDAASSVYYAGRGEKLTPDALTGVREEGREAVGLSLRRSRPTSVSSPRTTTSSLPPFSVTEALNPADEEFGEERLQMLMRQLAVLPVQEISARLSSELRAWIGTAAQHDDLTFVVMKVN